MSAAAAVTYSSSADLPTPASPRTTRTRPRPDRRSSRRPLSTARSSSRFNSAGTSLTQLTGPETCQGVWPESRPGPSGLVRGLRASSHDADQLVFGDAVPGEKAFRLLVLERVGQRAVGLLGQFRQPRHPQYVNHMLSCDLHRSPPGHFRGRLRAEAVF